MNTEFGITVEIWSDIACPFCYIAKRKLEEALRAFPQRDRVAMVWKSFQLQTGLQSDASKNAVDYLAETKGIPKAVAHAALANIAERAKAAGLNFDFGKAVVANTFDGHRLAHYAATQGKADEMVERLLEAYFVDGINIADHVALAKLAASTGLSAEESLDVLKSEMFADTVGRDIDEALRIGIRGVPYFLFNHKREVTGLQDARTYLEALEAALAEDISDHPGHANCDRQGNCR